MTNPPLGRRAQSVLRAVSEDALPPVNVLDLFDQPAPHADDYLMFAEVRTSGERVLACLSLLATVQAANPAARLKIAAMNHGDRDIFVITYSINWGPADQISHYGDNVLATFKVIEDVYKTMFDYFPNLAARPHLAAEDNSVASLRTIVEFLLFRDEHQGNAPARQITAAG